MCVATDDTGRGTRARHPCGTGTVAATENTAAGTSAITPDDANVEAADDDSRRSADAAQQLSACVWLTPVLDE